MNLKIGLFRTCSYFLYNFLICLSIKMCKIFIFYFFFLFLLSLCCRASLQARSGRRSCSRSCRTTSWWAGRATTTTSATTMSWSGRSCSRSSGKPEVCPSRPGMLRGIGASCRTDRRGKRAILGLWCYL